MGLARYGVGNIDFSLGINNVEEASRRAAPLRETWTEQTPA
jgi:hypothetical protein